jgi:LacI family transcriptional regulator
MGTYGVDSGAQMLQSDRPTIPSDGVAPPPERGEAINVEVVLGTRFAAAMPLIRGILRYAREHPAWCVRNRGNFEERCTFSGEDAEPDGVLALCNGDQAELVARYRKWGKPVVTFFADVPHEILPTVAMDEEAIGRLGAEHLLSQGFRRFAFCGADFSFCLLREKGFVDALAAAGAEPPVVRRGSGVEGRPTWREAARKRMVRWVTSLQPPVAVMAVTDEMARDVADIALEHGWRVPEDLAVLGVDDVEVVCEAADVPISSVHTDLPYVGYAAAAMLDALLRGEPTPAQPPKIPPRSVTLRASTDVLAFDDPDMLTAIRYIRGHACEGLTVSALARELSVSARSLQRMFQRTLRCRPGDEIRRVKVTRAREMLLETDDSLRQIAHSCGFVTLSQLCTAFRRTFGQTPQRFRRIQDLVLGARGRDTRRR